MKGRNGERRSGISAQAARHDDDDDDIYMCVCGNIYIYILPHSFIVCVYIYIYGPVSWGCRIH